MLKRILCTLAVFALAWQVSADPISPLKARQLASEYLTESSAEPLKLRRHAPARQGANQPLYIFSRGAGQGYVIVSGDDCLPAILGYTESGDFDEDNLAPGLRAWLSQYEVLILDAQAKGAPARVEPRKAAGTQNVDILLKSHWHQTWPYNLLCPICPDDGSTALTGCVATAAAQVLYYWRKDLNDRTQYNTPTYSINTEAPVKTSIKKGTPLKWDLLKTSYNGNESAEYTEAVAVVNYVIGTCSKMNYGHSSGAYIADLMDPFNRQFGLASKNIWKNSVSQTIWEAIIYEDLMKHHPIVFAGYTPEWEGHAIVLDGYQARTNLFHFNFGWGGQGDGWYTVDDETGVNGFGTEQSITYDIHPINPKADVEVLLHDGQLRSRINNDIRVSLTNNSTLAMQDFYMFCLSGTSKPSDIKKANGHVTALVQPGETATLEFEYRPTGTSKQTIYITDENLAILGKQAGIGVVGTEADLSLLGTAVDDGGTSEEMLIGGKKVTVKHIYDSKQVTAYATLCQNKQAESCQPTLYGYVYNVREDGSEVQSKSTSTYATVFQPGKPETVEFSFTNLVDGVLYRFALGASAHASKASDIKVETADSCVFFTLVGAKMQAEVVSDDEIRLSGNYNQNQFSQLAGNPQVARYDVTGLTGIHGTLTAANPNALFYADAGQGLAGRNIVTDGVCADLQLVPGFNFVPREDFKAMKAQFTPASGNGMFSTVCLPFDAPVPDGVFARRVNAIGTNYLDAVDAFNLSLQACTPYILVATGSPVFRAEQVEVSTEKAFTGSEAFVGTFRNLPVADGMMLLDNGSTQYFNTPTQDVVPAMTAYVLSEKKIRAISTEYSTKDKRTLALAEQIVEAQRVLRQKEFVSTPAAVAALQTAIGQACQTLTQQPETDVLTAAAKTLKEALDAYLAAVPKTDADGNADMTSLIVNPSFEQGSALTGWTKKSATSMAFTTEANFLSGADGAKVANIKKGGSLEQTVTGIEDGMYILTALFAADYGVHVTMIAGDEYVSEEASDFGPHYMKPVRLPNVHVTGGSLNIGFYADEDWVKVDNVRLYQVYPDAIEEVRFDDSDLSSTRRQGLYDLQGRRLERITQSGIYIQDGKLIRK